MYSSGTTGVPKCIVHGAGGTLLQHLKEHRLHCDVGSDDRLFYFTTCGWMMWNWLASGLASGATLVLFDGSPFHKEGRILWQVAERERITVFGTSAKYIAAQEKAGIRPKDEFDLGALKSILSTGSPLAPASFDYVYDAVADDVLLASITGGTDIISCFASGNPVLPVRRGEIRCELL
jgi:acetoacetyl-CoA synthetase